MTNTVNLSARRGKKSAEAFCTISEVASDLDSFPEARIFHSLLPFPENGHATLHQTNGQNLGSVFAKDDETAGTIDGYQWALDNWGTKWGDCSTRYEVAQIC